jgi:hypothetical protein
MASPWATALPPGVPATLEDAAARAAARRSQVTQQQTQQQQAQPPPPPPQPQQQHLSQLQQHQPQQPGLRSRAHAVGSGRLGQASPSLLPGIAEEAPPRPASAGAQEKASSSRGHSPTRGKHMVRAPGAWCNAVCRRLIRLPNDLEGGQRPCCADGWDSSSTLLAGLSPLTAQALIISMCGVAGACCALD